MEAFFIYTLWFTDTHITSCDSLQALQCGAYVTGMTILKITHESPRAIWTMADQAELKDQ